MRSEVPRVEEVDQVVADGLVRRDELDRWLRHPHGGTEVAQGEEGVRVPAEVLDGAEEILRTAAQLGGLAEGRHAGLKSVIHEWQNMRQ